MKFLVDAHSPSRLCTILRRRGHYVMHTLNLPRRNLTKDEDINRISAADYWIVVFKDTDFFYSHLLTVRPWKLLLVRTGNISTADLCGAFERHLAKLKWHSSTSRWWKWTGWL